uniref:Retrovirus-related Pol polyprotein from transposon TNT 1-94 n=1 Tax=Tanacetum cinerariifolium TaxID=118510 RepID=A0A6L2M958_TANCI|nr:hypothetical protein [Tanacetum cinerariifolium]
MDEDFVPYAKRLRIGRSNFCLLSNIKSKESTLKLVYDVLRLTLFFKAFLFTVDVLKIYMQEVWATATVHHHSIRFNMDNKKHIVNLESFREMLHICPRQPHQPFVEPPFEEEILAFLHFLGHSGAIRKLTDVEHKDTKKSNEMYYPQFTKNTQQFDALLPIELTNEDIRNSNAYQEYYAVATGVTPPKPKASVWKTRSSFDRTITPPIAAAGPRLTTFKKGKQAAKASKAKSLSSLSKVAMTEAQQMKLATKRSLQQTHISQASGSSTDEGTGSIPEVPDVPIDESEEEISGNSNDEEGDDDEGKDGNGDDDDDGDDGEEGDGDDDENDVGEEGNDADDDQEDKGDDDEDDKEKGGDDEQASDEEEPRDEESFDPILKIPEDTDDEGNGEENLGLNQSSSVSSQFLTSMINTTPDAGMESIFETTSQMDVQTPTSVAHLPMFALTITPSIISTITTTQQAPTPPTTAPSTLIQDLPNFGSLFGFDNRMRTFEANFFEFMQTNQFAGAVSAIHKIV